MANDESKTILLIDDDTSLLVTLSDFLRFEGYDVVTAESGEQGIKKLATLSPDLIILDMSMPGMGGIGFLQTITEGGKPEYPVLVLTARANMAEFFANVEVDGFIAKPCAPEDLLMEVGRIMFLRSGAEQDRVSGKGNAARKILVGEDDAVVTRALRKAMESEGYVATFVTRGPDIIEQAILQRPDVIAVKQTFSKMNGDAVAEMLREMPNARDIPVVLYGVGERYTEQKPPRGVDRIVPGNDPVTLVHAIRKTGIL